MLGDRGLCADDELLVVRLLCKVHDTAGRAYIVGKPYNSRYTFRVNKEESIRVLLLSLHDLCRSYGSMGGTSALKQLDVLFRDLILYPGAKVAVGYEEDLANNVKWRYLYNNSGDLTYVSGSNGETITNSYDPSGKVTARTVTAGGIKSTTEYTYVDH